MHYFISEVILLTSERAENQRDDVLCAMKVSPQ